MMVVVATSLLLLCFCYHRQTSFFEMWIKGRWQWEVVLGIYSWKIIKRGREREKKVNKNISVTCQMTARLSHTHTPTSISIESLAITDMFSNFPSNKQQTFIRRQWKQSIFSITLYLYYIFTTHFTHLLTSPRSASTMTMTMTTTTSSTTPPFQLVKTNEWMNADNNLVDNNTEKSIHSRLWNEWISR